MVGCDQVPAGDRKNSVAEPSSSPAEGTSDAASSALSGVASGEGGARRKPATAEPGSRTRERVGQVPAYSPDCRSCSDRGPRTDRPESGGCSAEPAVVEEGSTKAAYRAATAAQTEGEELAAPGRVLVPPHPGPVVVPPQPLAAGQRSRREVPAAVQAVQAVPTKASRVAADLPTPTVARRRPGREQGVAEESPRMRAP